MSHSRVNNQPAGQHGMVVAPGGGGNRNAQNMPVDADGRDWSNGLCGCCSSCGTCICATVLPCVVYGKNKHRYQHLDQQGTPEPSPGCCSGSCVAHGIFAACGLGFIFQMVNRGHVRHRYNIKGSGCGDCCTSFWCSPCQLVQESREIELEEQSFGTGRY
ncbi:PLAC8 family-domain-containing protein [Crepidotus variabilis]|uniref:PLAC8 family-domain-containing protein n=1 Tax=Crepidotus variabilis TaxID=179855 RepID=A0A9P6E8D5_9AGAR|nr:PLAC8 family-domain-containing protein [Crepidotus variabilis]